MSRAALIVLMALGAGPLGAATALASNDPHMDPGLVPSGCAACHLGHGVSRSPMLAESQEQVCMSCHGSSTGLHEKIEQGDVAPNARPPLLTSALSQPFSHPLTRAAFSQYEPNAVTCTSCHSPHRGTRAGRLSSEPTGRPRVSPKDPARFEYELCESCHGNAGATTQSLLDISRIFNPMNRSYHPVEAPSAESSPSVIDTLVGQQINCTDCHGNDDPSGPRGPHGSSVRYILRGNHPTLDGSSESPSAYALCYSCHKREKLLQNSPFPEHGRHIIQVKAACSTCHNAHGSVANRALIRFGEETMLAGVSPSVSTNRLAFVSEAPGSGACFLTCHGYDHAPEAYGSEELLAEHDSDLMLLGPGAGLGGSAGGWNDGEMEKQRPRDREASKRIRKK